MFNHRLAVILSAALYLCACANHTAEFQKTHFSDVSCGANNDGYFYPDFPIQDVNRNTTYRAMLWGNAAVPDYFVIKLVGNLPHPIESMNFVMSNGEVLSPEATTDVYRPGFHALIKEPCALPKFAGRQQQSFIFSIARFTNAPSVRLDAVEVTLLGGINSRVSAPIDFSAKIHQVLVGLTP